MFLTQHVEVHCAVGRAKVVGGSTCVHSLIAVSHTGDGEPPSLRIQHQGTATTRGSRGEGSPVEGPGVVEGWVREGGARQGSRLHGDGCHIHSQGLERWRNYIKKGSIY